MLSSLLIAVLSSLYVKSLIAVSSLECYILVHIALNVHLFSGWFLCKFLVLWIFFLSLAVNCPSLEQTKLTRPFSLGELLSFGCEECFPYCENWVVLIEQTSPKSTIRYLLVYLLHHFERLLCYYEIVVGYWCLMNS